MVPERPPPRNRVERGLISALPRVNPTHRKSTRLLPGRRPFVVDARGTGGAEWRCVDFELGPECVWGHFVIALRQLESSFIPNVLLQVLGQECRHHLRRCKGLARSECVRHVYRTQYSHYEVLPQLLVRFREGGPVK